MALSPMEIIEMSISETTTVKKDEVIDNATEKKSPFEAAVSACGYGKFHYLLYIVILPATWATVFDTSNTSMILPSVDCDLKLTHFYKGVLNAAVYAGMVSSAFLWGFLGDVLGRRSIIVYGSLIDGTLGILTGLSQSYWVLVAFKFMSGFIVSGPYATLVTYCSEFHAMKDRPRLVLLIGVFNSSGAILNTGLAWSIIPHTWKLTLFNETFVYNPWRLYMSVCGVPIVIAGLCLFFFPESPKFLMSQGRNEEALRILRRIYEMNTGLPAERYPIHELESEKEVFSISKKIDNSDQEKRVSSLQGNISKKSIKTTLCQGMLQFKPLFHSPYGPRLLLVLATSFAILLTYNTVRLWQPQIFTTLSDFQSLNMTNSENLNFCEIMDKSKSMIANRALMNAQKPEHCRNNKVESSVYSYAMILYVCNTLMGLSSVVILNVMKNKTLLFLNLCVAFIVILAVNWSPNTVVTLITTCTFCAVLSSSVNLNISITVDLFPTQLRTMAVSLVMMMGRTGAILGNIMFPVLLEYSCFVPLIALASFVLLCIMLIFFIPKPGTNLK